MGLNIRLYNIKVSNTFTVSYKSGLTLGNPMSGFVLYNTYPSRTTDITISDPSITYGTQYWIKIYDTVTKRYIIENIFTHESCYFDCTTPTPTPTRTPTPTPTSTPTPTPTPTQLPATINWYNYESPLGSPWVDSDLEINLNTYAGGSDNNTFSVDGNSLVEVKQKSQTSSGLIGVYRLTITNTTDNIVIYNVTVNQLVTSNTVVNSNTFTALAGKTYEVYAISYDPDLTPTPRPTETPTPTPTETPVGFCVPKEYTITNDGNFYWTDCNGNDRYNPFTSGTIICICNSSNLPVSLDGGTGYLSAGGCECIQPTPSSTQTPTPTPTNIVYYRYNAGRCKDCSGLPTGGYTNPYTVITSPDVLSSTFDSKVVIINGLYLIIDVVGGYSTTLTQATNHLTDGNYSTFYTTCAIAQNCSGGGGGGQQL